MWRSYLLWIALILFVHSESLILALLQLLLSGDTVALAVSCLSTQF